MTSDPTVPTTAVVLCGGESRRFGSDKTRADLGGVSVLDALLSSLPKAWDVLCVGPERPTVRGGVRWTREDPPGGGPVAGLAAALGEVEAPVTVLLGGDMPGAGPVAVELAAALAGVPHADVVAGVDGDGRVQPLLAAYRTVALRAALPDRPAGTPLRRVLDGLRVHRVEVPERASRDIDTPEDLDAARHRLAP
ncbi:molybdenum cofactor guanylyltransferase [Knoellia sp. p5-6-4]|uniref:molybdenum cofactor guanylyltransferase n=1 Tax=unclassified Knoellia TaxID=2618719 RepID=UPI0023DBA61D|nr:NTP transferase domain-containing protein [Knoellia sp. p5-6-4]MDF2145243.1 NTP transferase domain-containing protein [Knoellia sp. p5-6-4]